MLSARGFRYIISSYCSVCTRLVVSYKAVCFCAAHGFPALRTNCCFVEVVRSSLTELSVSARILVLSVVAYDFWVKKGGGKLMNSCSCVFDCWL
jgi:hypothetical protein